MSDHEPEAHTSGHGGQDAHDAHVGAALGPIDWHAWSIAAVGGLVGVLVALSLLVAAQA